MGHKSSKRNYTLKVEYFTKYKLVSFTNTIKFYSNRSRNSKIVETANREYADYLLGLNSIRPKELLIYKANVYNNSRISLNITDSLINHLNTISDNKLLLCNLKEGKLLGVVDTIGYSVNKDKLDHLVTSDDITINVYIITATDHKATVNIPLSSNDYIIYTTHITDILKDEFPDYYIKLAETRNILEGSEN
jgi:hypothetical protein